jgi:hypothetical protein
MNRQEADQAIQQAVYGTADPEADRAALRRLTHQLFGTKPEPEPDDALTVLRQANAERVAERNAEPEHRMTVPREGYHPGQPRGDRDMRDFVNELFGRQP